jgi:hypothetical protein
VCSATLVDLCQVIDLGSSCAFLFRFRQPYSIFLSRLLIVLWSFFHHHFWVQGVDSTQALVDALEATKELAWLAQCIVVVSGVVELRD